MSELDSGVTPALLPESELPAYPAHSRAKHQLLRKYMDVWLPKLGISYPQVVLIDGFASAGRYRTNERGSPLLMLDAFVGRSDRHHLKSPPHFVFIESNKKFACHLKAEVDAYPDLYGATVDVVLGRYEDQFPVVVEWLSRTYRPPVPTFAFVDPLGYRDNPFDHIAGFRQLLPTKSEVMVYLPASFMARFVRTGITDAALNRLYGGSTWEEAAKTAASRQQAGEALASEFNRRLKGLFAWVTSFNVDPERHNDYYLLFGTDHKDGLREMKRGMWSVDQREGTGYRQGRTYGDAQGQLFPDSATETGPDLRSLAPLLRGHFGTRVFSIMEAEDFTLCRTKYLDRPHLRTVLRPLEAAGELQVVESSRRRAGDYPEGTRMRLTALNPDAR